jgi:hypothetical protein
MSTHPCVGHVHRPKIFWFLDFYGRPLKEIFRRRGTKMAARLSKEELFIVRHQDSSFAE